MNRLRLLLLLLITSFFAQAQETFPISPIGTQHVFPGAKITNTFSAVNHDLASIVLSAVNLPSFGSFQDHQKGFGTFTFEPNTEDIGEYIVSIQAISGIDTSRTSFKVIVPPFPSGNVYFVDPVNGNNDNAGTADQPWQTLAEVFSSGKPLADNDVLFLRSGNHGAPVVNKLMNSTTYILAEKGQTPMFEKLNFYLAKNWVLSGVKITPEANNTPAKGNYVRIQPTSSNITIENCEIYGTSDVMNWTTNQLWYDNAGDGLLINGTNNIIRNSYIYNIWFGITVDNTNNLIAYTMVNNFGADGVRGIASNCQFLYNRIQNALVDDYETGNHDDGFQSWTFGAPIQKVVLKGNQIFSHTDPSLPLKTSILQGLVNFDGFSAEWTIQDNLVLIDHPHGITLLGAYNCNISNNTVTNNPLQLFSYGNAPWIRIGPHKFGQKSTGNLNRNNLMGFNYYDGDPGTVDRNLIANTNYFVNYDHWNFHLKANSGPVNSGSMEGGSSFDNSQNIRKDSFPDIGCYEFGNQPMDFENPSVIPAGTVQLDELTPTSTTLSWDASTDNQQVKQYNISVDNQVIHTRKTSTVISGLSAETNYDIKLEAEDLAGNKSNPIIFNITTPILDTIITVTSDYRDQAIRSTNVQQWIGLWNHTIGGFTSFDDASAVIPFKLPEIPDGFSIKKANLIVDLNRIVNSPFGNVDLYAIGFRESPYVQPTDDWQGPFGTQPSTDTIQDDYITPTDELGYIHMSDSAKETLRNIINTNTPFADKYLILRLNSDKDNESNYRFFQIASADHPFPELRPRLELTISPTVGTTQINQSKLKIFPNPISDNSTALVQWPTNTLNGKLTVTLTNSAGQLLAKYSEYPKSNELKISAKLLPISGVYYLTISDLDKYFGAVLVKE